MSGKKIAYSIILAVVFISTSCTALRRSGRDSSEPGVSFDARRLMKEVMAENLSDRDFRMDRVRVVASINGDTYRFSGNLKFSKEGKLSFSARTIAGIEVARIYMDMNEIIVADRINRIYSTGSTVTLMERYGLKWDDIVVLFGDLPPTVQVAGRTNCYNNSTSIDVETGGRKITFVVDCAKKKVTGISVGASPGNDNFIASFTDMMMENGATYYSNAEISDGVGNMNLRINFGRYGLLDGEIKPPSMPGSYEKALLK